MEASSNILPGAVSMASGAMAITIVATELQGKSSFTGLTATHNTDFPGVQSIYATDVNGRVDRDFVSAITLTAHTTVCPNAAPGALGSGDGGGLTHNAVLGIATWTNLVYTLAVSSTGENIRIRAQAAGVTDLCSAQVTVTP